jgi:DNA gyrase/topoisomerase IV subunit A
MTPEERNKAQQRLELLEGIQKALDRWEDVSALVESAADRKDAIKMLGQPPLSFTDHQTYVVVDIPLWQRTQEGRLQLEEELEQLRAEIRRP